MGDIADDDDIRVGNKFEDNFLAWDEQSYRIDAPNIQ